MLIAALTYLIFTIAILTGYVILALLLKFTAEKLAR